MRYHACLEKHRTMERSAGVLVHPTSLPGRFAIGDLGPEAHAWLGWLAAAGVGWWQVLPLHPPGPSQSPYAATSSFAGSPWLISPEALVADGLLDAGELDGSPAAVAGHVDFAAAVPWKTELLARMGRRFEERASPELQGELERFREAHRSWLDDYALFTAIKEEQGGAAWIEWPRALAGREPEALAGARRRLAEEIKTVEIGQLLFHRQWRALRRRASELGIRVLGDVPIFVALDSADVWAHPELFQLDGEGRPTVVAGVPPDYFSATGQLWGNPLFAWERHEATGFSWWVQRLRHACTLVDAVRLDHFRGFVAYWEVPAQETVAVNGRWVPGPGRALFDAVRRALGGLPLVAEDLGDITPDVIDLRRELGLPGMAILQFGFSPEPRSTFIPYSHRPDLVVYTGTHDNNTSAGWFRDEASDGERGLLLRYAGSDGREVHWDLIRLAFSSVAELAVVPVQDVLGLGAEARMNTPGRGDGNWGFRLDPGQPGEAEAARLGELAWTYGRAPAGFVPPEPLSSGSTRRSHPR